MSTEGHDCWEDCDEGPHGCVCGNGCTPPRPEKTPTVTDLLPAESIALTVGLAQVQRGEIPDPNVVAMCVLALARLAGRHDWTKETSDD